MEHPVTEIQRFCMHDGPGIRTTVFLKGCPLRCFWCHNPETRLPQPQLLFYRARCIGCGACEGYPSDPDKAAHCPTGARLLTGRRMQTEEIIAAVLRDRAFYGSDGGLTLSGGEPMRDPEGCLALLRAAKEAGLHTAVETCGYFDPAYLEPLCAMTDLLLWDVKDTDDARHRANTGVGLDRILANLRQADRYGVPIVLRCILLKGVNLNEAHLTRLRTLFASLKNGVRVDLLPCHAMGGAKAEALSLPPVDLTDFLPDEADMAFARSVLFSEA